MAYSKHNPSGRGTVEKRIREALKASDGLTEENLKAVVSTSQKSIADVLAVMPDAYIDRWVVDGDDWAPVWCVVDVPQHSPKPAGRPT